MYLGTKNLYLEGKLFYIILIDILTGYDKLLIVLTTLVITLESGGNPLGKTDKIKF